MQLDRSQIAIYERTWVENLDLALHVIRAHGKGITLSALAGILPMLLVNYAIFDWFHSDSFSDELGVDSFIFSMFLVMIEAPLATAPLTLYLGQALFEPPQPKKIARDFVACLPQLMTLQVFLRTVLILPVLTWIIPYSIWPYLNEVILLERNPMFSRRGQLSTLKRNTSLHLGNSADFITRGLAALILAPLLMWAFWVTQGFLLDTVLGFEAGWTSRYLGMQLVLWLVIVYFTVARFLSYLDQRIRTEGWEVELLMRAQRDRLTGRAA